MGGKAIAWGARRNRHDRRPDGQPPRESHSRNGSIVRSLSFWRWRLFFVAALVLSGSGCSAVLVPVTPTEPLGATAATAVAVAVEGLRLGDDTLVDGVEDEATIAVQLTVTNRGVTPYQLGLARTSLWLALDPRRPDATLSWAPIGGGDGTAPDELTVVATLPTIVVPPGQSARAWVQFRGYRFDGSEIPRQVTLNIPGPPGSRAEVIRVTLADPARGTLRWRAPARRSQLMVGFHNTTFVGGAFQGMAPATVLARVARLGPLLWDVGLVSGMAIQQKGLLKSSTSAFSTIGLLAHVTMPLFSWGAGHDVNRFGLYAGGGAAVWSSVLTTDETKAGQLPSTVGVWSTNGGIELSFGSVVPAATPFPLEPQPHPGLPRWGLRFGYTQAWLAGGTAGGLVSTFRVQF